MSNKQGNNITFGGAVMAVMLLAFIGWILRAGWIEFADLVSKQGAVAAAIIGFFATVMAATITVVIGRWLERRKEVENAHRTKQIEVFDEYVVMFYDYLLNPDKMTEQSEQFVAALKTFAPKITIWGKVATIKAFGDFRTYPEGGSSVERLHIFERFMATLRSDLGHGDVSKDIVHSGGKLNRGDLLRIIINDYDSYMKKHQNS